MGTEATLDLLYRELDHSMLENENSHNNSYISPIEEEDEGEEDNLLGSSILKEEPEQQPTHEDDEVNTQVNANSPLLSSPFKMQDNTSHINVMDNEFPQPPTMNMNIETLSGGTYINHSNRQSNMMSPGSVKLINAFENQDKQTDDVDSINEDDHLIENSILMEKVRINPTIPHSFSLESTKPLLAHDSNKDGSTPAPYRLSMISTNGKDNELDVQESPQVIQSPSKIPLTNTKTINEFISTTLSEDTVNEHKNKQQHDQNIVILNQNTESNLEVPATRFSSGSSYNDDKIELNTTNITDQFNLLKDNHSSIQFKEDDKLDLCKSRLPSNDVSSNFDKLYKSRMTSIATSIGDYQSAKENQTKSQLVSETSDSIDELNISTGIEFPDETLQLEDDENESSSSIANLTEHGDISHSHTLDMIPEQDMIALTETSQEEDQKHTSEIISKENVLEELNVNESIVSEENVSNIPQDDSFSDKMYPNKLLIDSLNIGTSRESTQTLDIDVDSFMNKKKDIDFENDSTRNVSGSTKEDEEIQLNLKIEDKESFQGDNSSTRDISGLTKQDKELDTNSEIENNKPLKENDIDLLEEKQGNTTPDNIQEDIIEKAETIPIIPKVPNVRIPSLEKQTSLESKFIDDIFNTDSDTSFDSIEKDILNKKDNYLSIWHLQEKKQPGLNLNVKGYVNDIIPKKSAEKSKPKVKEVKYSFKPKIVHNPKINYQEKNYSDKNMPVSLSQEFENALKTLTNESPSRSVSILRRPVNIWSRDENGSSIEKMQDTKEMSLKEVFGEDFSEDTLKTPAKTALVNKAVSVRSLHVDMDYESINNMHVTPRQEKSPMRGLGHIESPFKIISKSKKTEQLDNIKKEELDIPDLKSLVEDVVELPPEEIKEDSTMHKEEEPITGGMLFINLDNITVSLTGVKQHDAKFSLEIDNGINVTKTEWKSLDNDNRLLLDNELAIPIEDLQEKKLFLTLKCKYRRPKRQLVEVVERIKVGKSFGGLGKNKYVYEKKFAEKDITYDEWDYLFAKDGSFAKTELNINNEFLERSKSYNKKTRTEGMFNQWAKLITSNKQMGKVTEELPRRSPFVAASFKYNSYYAQRTHNEEIFPNTLKVALAMAQKYKNQQDIRKEGFLVQDGGDLNGLIEKRYFKLHGTDLVGYNERSMKAKIEINLLNVKKITSTMDDDDDTSKTKSTRNFTNLFLFGDCFTLVFNNNESINFNCQMSNKNTRDWYVTLKEVIDMNVTHQPWIKSLAENI